VTDRGGGNVTGNRRVTGELSADQAEVATGISKMQVSRWGERLADAEAAS
jgi:hypothetical protein